MSFRCHFQVGMSEVFCEAVGVDAPPEIDSATLAMAPVRSGEKMEMRSPTRTIGPAWIGESSKALEFSSAMMRDALGMKWSRDAPMAPMKPTSSALVKRRRMSFGQWSWRSSSSAARAAAAAARSSQALV